MAAGGGCAREIENKRRTVSDHGVVQIQLLLVLVGRRRGDLHWLARCDLDGRGLGIQRSLEQRRVRKAEHKLSLALQKGNVRPQPGEECVALGAAGALELERRLGSVGL